MSDPVVGMPVSDLVGAQAVTTASGYVGAQIVAAFEGQGIKAGFEGPPTQAQHFNRASVVEQPAQRTAAAPAPSVAPLPGVTRTT